MENVKIAKAKKLKGGAVKFDVAFETCNFGSIVIKGFRVSRSRYEKPWVQEPSYQVFGQYYRCVYFEDRKVWDGINELLTTEYSNYVSEEERMDEDVDPKEVPI